MKTPPPLSVLEVQRLSAEIMRERALDLGHSFSSARSRLEDRTRELARLRAEIAALRAALRPAPLPRVDAAPEPEPVPVVVAIPAKEAAPDSARAQAASLARIAPAPFRWGRLAPYAVIVGCALMIELSGGGPSVGSSADLFGLVHPAAAVPVPAGPLPAQGAPVAADGDRSQEALLLVHQWRLPGDAQDLLERLGGAVEPPGSRPSWSVERVSEVVYRVSYAAAEGAPAYAFDADLDSRQVWPTAETEELLAPRLASLRDAR